MQLSRTKFRKSFILSTKNWIKCFPGKNLVNSREKSGDITGRTGGQGSARAGPRRLGEARERRRKGRARSRHRCRPSAGRSATGAQGLGGPEVAGNIGQPAIASANRRGSPKGIHLDVCRRACKMAATICDADELAFC